MTQANLRAFYFQNNPAKMPGSVTGEVDLNSLGILCDKQPVYDSSQKSSDVRDCKIAVPEDAKPGVFRLTPERSRIWFHQDNPACFVEAVLPYYSTPEDMRSGLRVNIESCDWRFDSTKKCFDYSKCTFTVPQFAE